MKKKKISSIISNFYNYLLFLLMDFIIKRKKNTSNPGKILLIKLDSIGDYILFRNFIPILRDKYKNNKITFCGNSEIEELVLSLDKEYFDEFIWINRLKFLNNPFYKYRILKNLYARGFESAINTAYTREILFGDQMIKTSSAKNRIGSTGSPDQKKRTKLLTDRFYTELLPQTESNLFEFFRNKEFFELLLNTAIDIKSPAITPPDNDNEFNLNKYVILFPGAKDDWRSWSSENFAIIGNYIINNSAYNIVIAGSSNDKIRAEKIILGIDQKGRVKNLAGKTSIIGLIKLLASSDLLVSNDTGAVHIAAALNKKFICISNGNHIGRFHPYPASMIHDSCFVYPDEIKESDYEKFRFGSSLDINSINSERVINMLREVVGLK